MRFDRDRMIFMALMVLDEVCEECGKGPLKPSFSIRLALATLYALGKGEKHVFEDFWNEMRKADYGHHTPTQVAYLRPTYTRTHFTQIARSVGVELSLDYMKRMEKVRAKRREWSGT